LRPLAVREVPAAPLADVNGYREPIVDVDVDVDVDVA
jgi:hypothetical protein